MPTSETPTPRLLHMESGSILALMIPAADKAVATQVIRENKNRQDTLSKPRAVYFTTLALVGAGESLIVPAGALLEIYF